MTGHVKKFKPGSFGTKLSYFPNAKILPFNKKNGNSVVGAVSRLCLTSSYTVVHARVLSPWSRSSGSKNVGALSV